MARQGRRSATIAPSRPKLQAEAAACLKAEQKAEQAEEKARAETAARAKAEKDTLQAEARVRELEEVLRRLGQGS